MTSRLSPVTDADAPSESAPVSLRALSIGICTVVLAIAFESIAVATAMPVAARDLDGLPYYAWSFSLFLIGMLFGTVVTGRLADRIGPVKPMVAGVVIFAVGLLVAGLAEVMGQLVAGRFVQGLGGGAMNTASFVIIAQAYPPDRRPRMFTYISTAWVVPAFVGPPIAAWLVATLSWHWVFFSVLPLVAFGAAMLAPTLIRLSRSYEPTDPEQRVKPVPLWAAGLIAIAAAAIQLAGQRLDLIALPILAVGIAGLLLSLPKLMPDDFLRLGRGLSAVILVRALLPGAFFGAEAFIPLMLVEQRQLALVLSGVMLTIGAVGWTFASWLQSQRWVHTRRDRLITYGTLSVAVGIAACSLAAFVPALWFGVVGIGWLFAGFGMGLATASTSLAVMSLSAPEVQGRSASSLNLGDALGSSIFVGVSGSIFAALSPTGVQTLTFGVVMASMVVVALLATAASLRIGRISDPAAA